jgi:uridine monophosphate synthetase
MLALNRKFINLFFIFLSNQFKSREILTFKIELVKMIHLITEDLMKTNTLIEALYKINAVKFGDFTLKSGQASKIYLDLRQIISYPDILRAVAEEMWHTVHSTKFDLVCGVPYTALPIATCISLQHNIPMIMRRKEKKDYGTKQQIEGNYQTGQSCLIIEDVITTGGSIVETADELDTVGLKVKDLAILIDRQQGGRENLENKGFSVHSVFTIQEILQTLSKSHLLSAHEKNIVSELMVEV